MIGKLTGIVDTITEDTVILDVNGVGYLVQCPASTLSRLTVGAHASLMIEMKVSEDAIKLYGFASAEEREWFRLLQTVQNVGGKVALSARREGPEHVRIVVADSGPGIPEADTERVFQPFVSGKPSGMGLGLAVSRAIVEAHGGTLQSRPAGHGELHIVLPIDASHG